MTDPLSERLESEIRLILRINECTRVADTLIRSIVPILQDEIAAVRERTLEEAADKLDEMLSRDTLNIGSDDIRALKTPQPEVTP